MWFRGSPKLGAAWLERVVCDGLGRAARITSGSKGSWY